MPFETPYAEHMSINWKTPLSPEELQLALDGDHFGPASHPAGAPWGYYLQLERLGYFSWFASQAELLRYLVHIELLHAPERFADQAAYNTAVQALIPVGQAYVSAALDAAAAAEVFSGHLSDGQLLWLGQLSALEQDDSAFARQLRQAFQGTEDPVPPAAQAAFADWLEGYGL